MVTLSYTLALRVLREQASAVHGGSAPTSTLSAQAASEITS